MAATVARQHETRALLRAHLQAASGYRHRTRHCPICLRLLRLAMEPAASDPDPAPTPCLAPSRRPAPAEEATEATDRGPIAE
ncbi:DUF6274 family protein [Streptomyces sp. NBC_01142]|uniref:DUF6274 family protein n=1 Tax=Streptomyces sp. NBC_01142 TaxID=2975865 RepID=UPI002252C696|nr:DUF6274 family protein [Streptomyces sp. NBC_01142]MCX4824140.1 DUF6274 family protein [Streptomyces sp. NBC_01142]